MPRYPTIISKAPFTRFFLQSEFAFSSIPGLKLDINPVASKVNGGSVNNGDPIESLQDSYTTTITYTQTTNTKRPLWTESDADFAGNPSMVFDGYDDFLIKNSSFGSSKGAIFAVVKVGQLNDLQVVMGSADVSSSTKYLQYSIPHYSYNNQYIEVNNAGVNPAVRGNTTLALQTYIVNVNSNGTSWDLWLTGNNEVENIVAYGNRGDWFSDFTGADNLSIGMLKRNIEVGALTGKIARMLVWDNVSLSTTQIALIHTSLKQKYGVS